MKLSERVPERVRWWSGTASVIVVVFVALGAGLLAAGRDPGGIVCVVLAVAYVAMRLARGYLGAAGRLRRHG